MACSLPAIGREKIGGAPWLYFKVPFCRDRRHALSSLNVLSRTPKTACKSPAQVDEGELGLFYVGFLPFAFFDGGDDGGRAPQRDKQLRDLVLDSVPIQLQCLPIAIVVLDAEVDDNH